MTQYYLGAFGCTSTPRAPTANGGALAAVTHTDYAWNRLTRTIDLTGVSAAQAPVFRTQLLWDTEEAYDHAVLEAHTAGADDWTTLPEVGGATSATPPVECEAGYFIAAHPALTRYLTLGDGACTPTGTSGSWNSFTGASDGWQEVGFDLSAYAGRSVEISLSYITDPGSGGHGVLADNASVVIGGTAVETEGFETSLGAWSTPGPPAGSPAVIRDWGLSGELFKTYGAVTTGDTVLLGFGLEHVTAVADRTALLGKALAALKD